jgi:hypothetical protein
MHIRQFGDVHALRDRLDVPGLGHLPVNAFLLHTEAPVLVDTGLPASRADFLDALGSLIDPRELRWIWLTHPDRDHLGSLHELLAAAPQAQLACSAVTAAYLALEHEIPEERVLAVAPGDTVPLGGGRSMHAFRPPLYDSPMTLGFFDDGNGACFSADCFGAVLPTADSADATHLGELPAEQVRVSQSFWAGFDSPWVHMTDPARFAASYQELRRFQPRFVFSAHLPPAENRCDDFLDLLAALPGSEPTPLPELPAEPAELLRLAIDGDREPVE